MITEHRWWSVDELRTTEDLVVWPSKVADHLEALLAADPDRPTTPVALEPELDRT